MRWWQRGQVKFRKLKRSNRKRWGQGTFMLLLFLPCLTGAVHGAGGAEGSIDGPLGARRPLTEGPRCWHPLLPQSPAHPAAASFSLDPPY